MQLELVSTYIDWNASSQGRPTTWEAFTAAFNRGPGNATVRTVQLPMPVSWRANETLLKGGYWHVRRCMLQLYM